MPRLRGKAKLPVKCKYTYGAGYTARLPLDAGEREHPKKTKAVFDFLQRFDIITNRVRG